MEKLFISGYDAGTIRDMGVDQDAEAFLAKPFTRAVLAAKIRSVLAGDNASRPRSCS